MIYVFCLSGDINEALFRTCSHTRLVKFIQLISPSDYRHPTWHLPSYRLHCRTCKSHRNGSARNDIINVVCLANGSSHVSNTKQEQIAAKICTLQRRGWTLIIVPVHNHVHCKMFKTTGIIFIIAVILSIL